MPCSDGRDFVRTEYVEAGVQTQRLCAVFTAMQKMGILDKVLKAADWAEAGTSLRGAEQWWARHQLEDAQRRARERKELEEKRKRAAVLAQLTPEQKKILNLK